MVGPGDFLAFLDDLARDDPHVKTWKESTRKKLASNTLSALRDFGLLKGTRKRVLQRPGIAPETIFHLLADFGRRGATGASRAGSSRTGGCSSGRPPTSPKP